MTLILSYIYLFGIGVGGFFVGYYIWELIKWFGNWLENELKKPF